MNKVRIKLFIDVSIQSLEARINKFLVGYDEKEWYCEFKLYPYVTGTTGHAASVVMRQSNQLTVKGDVYRFVCNECENVFDTKEYDDKPLCDYCKNMKNVINDNTTDKDAKHDDSDKCMTVTEGIEKIDKALGENEDDKEKDK